MEHSGKTSIAIKAINLHFVYPKLTSVYNFLEEES